MSTEIVAVQDLTAGYGPVEALHSVSLRIEEGEAVCVLGPNGAGKSTLLRAISGLLPARSGVIRVAGKELGRTNPSEIARLGVAHVPQGRRCFVGLSVEENLLIGGYRLPKEEGKKDLERIYSIFPVLAQKREQLAAELSGGQQQMLAIGRGLMARPIVLLLDEPSLGLAPVLVQELGDTLRRLASERQMAVLLVEQNVPLALRVTDRGYVFQGGCMVLEGPSEYLTKHVRDAYLGTC